jgi:hypothetical protein
MPMQVTRHGIRTATIQTGKKNEIKELGYAKTEISKQHPSLF